MSVSNDLRPFEVQLPPNEPPTHNQKLQSTIMKIILPIFLTLAAAAATFAILIVAGPLALPFYIAITAFAVSGVSLLTITSVGLYFYFNKQPDQNTVDRPRPSVLAEEFARKEKEAKENLMAGHALAYVDVSPIAIPNPPSSHASAPQASVSQQERQAQYRLHLLETYHKLAHHQAEVDSAMRDASLDKLQQALENFIKYSTGIELNDFNKSHREPIEEAIKAVQDKLSSIVNIKEILKNLESAQKLIASLSEYNSKKTFEEACKKIENLFSSTENIQKSITEELSKCFSSHLSKLSIERARLRESFELVKPEHQKRIHGIEEVLAKGRQAHGDEEYVNLSDEESDEDASNTAPLAPPKPQQGATAKPGKLTLPSLGDIFSAMAPAIPQRAEQNPMNSSWLDLEEPPKPEAPISACAAPSPATQPLATPLPFAKSPAETKAIPPGAIPSVGPAASLKMQDLIKRFGN